MDDTEMRALLALAPIVGITVGDPANRDTWALRFRDDATAEQRAAATAAMAAINPLNSRKRTAIAAIDQAAEAARLRRITGGAGMALTYQRKSMERMALLSAVQTSSPVTRDLFPMLWASVGVEVPASGNDAADLAAVAALVGTREAQYATVGAAIESARLAAKAAVAAATTEEGVKAAAAVVWP